MFKFFQDIEFKDMDFFRSLKNSIPIESHDVCEKLIANEEIEDFGIKLNAKDTISIPVNSKVTIEINEQEESLLNCVTQI